VGAIFLDFDARDYGALWERRSLQIMGTLQATNFLL